MKQTLAQRVPRSAGRVGILLVALGIAALSTRADDWDGLADRPPSGVSVERWHHLLGHLREKPYTVAEIQPCLNVIEMAVSASLPAEPVVTRLEEGVVKRADPADLQNKVRQRLLSLRKAGEMMKDAELGSCAAPIREELMASLATARESQVAAEGLRRLLQLAGGVCTCRLRTTVEAGESLKLMGLDDPSVSGLMEDFMKREMCCGEILRATRFAGQKHREGLTGPAIRDRLWEAGAKNFPRRNGRAHDCSHQRSP